MKTLNDKRLEKASKEKKKRIKENRDELNNVEIRRREQSRNTYLENFWKNGDYVIWRWNWTLVRMRYNKEDDTIKMIDEHCDFLVNNKESFFRKTEYNFNS